MPSTQTFTLGTWNLQKGPALQTLAKQNLFAAAALSARYQILGYLHGVCDVVFVQEAGVDIRDETQKVKFDGPYETHENAWLSYNKDLDNQIFDTACRPAFFSKHTMKLVEVPSDCPGNGGEDAFRLSAMGWAVTTGLGEGIFISLHATSGSNAKKNTKTFLEWLAKWVPAEYKGVRFVLIGADFNHPCDAQLDVGGLKATFRQPNDITQQSGSILDGFCCLVIDPAITVKWMNAQRVCTGELDGPIKTKMVQVNPNIGQMQNQRGYIGELLPSAQMPGTNLALHSTMNIRMSDHCAVVGKIELTSP